MSEEAPDTRQKTASPGGPGGSAKDSRDMAGSEYWADARPIRTGAGRLRHAVHRHLRRKFDRMLVQTLATVPAGASVLEIGCAPGWTLVQIARIRPDLKLAGLDYAASGVRQTREMLESESVTASIAEGDMRTYEPSRLHDAVLSTGLIEHYTEPAMPVEQHRRLARAGGTVVITIPNLRTTPVRVAASRFDAEDFETHNLDVMDPEVLGSLLTGAGLTNVSCGRGGGAAMFVPRQRASVGRRLYAVFAYGWNLIAAALPDALSPWHAHIWASGSVPSD